MYVCTILRNTLKNSGLLLNNSWTKWMWYCRGVTDYLICTSEAIYCPMYVVHTGRQIVWCNPMTGILSSLCGYFGYFHQSAKVHLQPLIVVPVFGTPGSYVTASLHSSQSPKPSSMVTVYFWWCSDLVVTDTTILQSQGTVTQWHWNGWGKRNETYRYYNSELIIRQQVLWYQNKDITSMNNIWPCLT